MDASEEDEADESDEEERGEDADADGDPEIPVKPPTPVRPSKRAAPLVDAAPGKRSDCKSPAKKQKAMQPETPAVHPSKEIKSSKDKPAIPPAQVVKQRIPKFPTAPLSAAQAIQAGVQAKKTFSSLAFGKNKMKLKKPENDPDLAAAAQFHTLLEKDIHEHHDVDVEHQQPDADEEGEDGEVSDGNAIIFATITNSLCADVDILAEDEGTELEAAGT